MTSKDFLAIGVDLGGTNIKAALVDAFGKILAKHAQPATVNRGPDAVIADIEHAIRVVLGAHSHDRALLKGIGVGAPGPLSPSKGVVIGAANLPGWQNIALRDRISLALGLPVVLDNDGNVAAFGEFWAGSGAGDDDVVLLTLGTGVGAGVVIDGATYRGQLENAAEIGHVIVVPDGLPCVCGKRGCLEQYASASSVARRVQGGIERGEHCSLTLSGEKITAEAVASAAQQCDPLCERVWDEACKCLGVMCVNIQHMFNPARILLGGGMSQAGALLLNRVRTHFETHRWTLHNDFPRIELASLGYDAGVIGAAGLVLSTKA